MLRRGLLASALLLVLLAGGGVAVARSAPDLSAGGKVSVSGTAATAVFQIADRTIRQVRYDDGGTLRYTFRLTNEGSSPVTVLGLSADQPDPRLFGLAGLTGADGGVVRIAAGESEQVTLALTMSGCESLSARAGSFVSQVVVGTERAGGLTADVTVRLPEEIHTGSPREAFCPESTATSRPPG